MGTKLDQFKQCFEYSELRRKYSFNDTGLWQVFGEDPNPDFGGYHTKPSLGFFKGTLAHVIGYAVELPDFWTWGAGGCIEQVSPITEVTSDSLLHRKAKVAKLNELKEQVARLSKELEGA